MKDPVRLLHLEDNPRDAELIRHQLETGGLACDIVLVNGKEAFEAALAQEPFDLILCDYKLPGYDGLSALKQARETQPDTPVIMISGTLGEELAVECLKLGATDFVLKHQTGRLAPSVVRALAEAKEHRQRQAAEERLLLATQAAQVGIWDYDLVEDRLVWDDSMCALYGVTLEEFTRSTGLWARSVHPDDLEHAEKTFQTALKSGKYYEDEFRVVWPDGSIHHISALAMVQRDESGNPVRVVGTNRDITKSQQAEEALRESEENLRITLNSIGDAVISTDTDGRVTHVNPVAEALSGWKEADATGKPLEEMFRIINAKTRKTVENPVTTVLATGKTIGLANHTLLIAKDGTETPIADSAAPIKNKAGEVTGVVLVFRDQTEAYRRRHITETRLELLEYAAEHPLSDLLTEALDEVGKLVNSPIGFYHFVEADQKTLSLQQWSTRTLKEFCHTEGHGMHYDVAQAGVWTDCVKAKAPVIHNDYASLPHKKGLPEGHAPIIRELVVPVMRNGKVVAILGVGNKPDNYTEADVETVSNLADLTWDIVQQKRSEEALRESEEQFRSTVEDLLVGVVVHAADSSILLSNPQASRILGLSREQMAGKKDIDPAWHFVHEDLSVMAVDDYPVHRVIATGQPLVNQILGINRPDRVETIWVTVSAVPVFTEENELSRVIVNFMDITEHKEAEKKLQFEQSLFHSFMETIPASVFFKDLDSRFVRANPLSAPRLGAKNVEELIGKTDFDFFPEEEARLRYEQEQQILRTGQPAQVEERGFGRWVLTTRAPWYGENGELAGTFGISTDITDKKLAEQALEESRQLMRVVLDTIPGRVWWKDLNSAFLGCNLHFAHDAELDSPDQLIGKTDYDMCWKKQADHFVADDREVIESGKPKLGIQEFQTQADGNTRWIETNKVPLRDNEGRIIGTVGSYADITERKRMQEAIEKRVLALTRPLDSTEGITFDDLFDLNEMQRMQDEFAAATGVASLILTPDGVPITQPSNFTPLCMDIIRKTEKGCANCRISDTAIGRHHPEGPIVQPCLSGGLWDAGVALTVGEKHIANWLIGQVRDETQTDENMRAYAREIGADEKEFMDAFYRVPVMSHEKFKAIANALFTLANQLSTSAYQNLQQARFIADEKRRTEELSRLSTAIEQSPEAIVITDPDGIIQYVNPAFETVTGYSSEEAIGENPRILKSGEQTKAFYTELWNTITSGNPWTGRFINKRKNGTLYTEEAIISQVKDPTGAIINYVAVKRDITKELLKEEEFHQAQKMESVGQLAGGIAHDFNNILQVILLFSELLLDGLPEGSKQHKNAEEIKTAAERAADLTRQLLTFSRKQPANRVLLNLSAMIKETKGMIQALLDHKTKLVLDLAQDLVLVDADKGQLSQLIMNLAVNARDAMPKGGRLTLSTENIRLTPPDTAGIPRSKAGDFICLSITDTGHGMSQQVKDHLFDPFFTTKEVGKGTGLGLAVVYGIVEAHHGWINVYSEEDQGTTFKIYLPSHQHDDAPGESESKEMRHERILLVEDDADMRDMVLHLLQGGGYQVSTAETTEEALALFDSRTEKFDMLFSDIVLEKNSGIELADTLRKKFPALPVLLYSAYRDPQERWRDLDSKGYHFLQKPFTITTLMMAVYETLMQTDQT